jgi:hypothetical protein
MIAAALREAALMFALIAGTVTDIRKREVSRPSLFLMALAGALTLDGAFIMQSAMLLAAFCVWIAVKKTDIGFGGGDIWVMAALTFAVGLTRALLSLLIGFFILVAANKIRFGRISMKKEAALIPFIAAGHAITLIIIIGVLIVKEHI